MLLVRRLRRGAAAALAALALVSAGVRPVLACEMASPDAANDAASAVALEHAHHHEPATPVAPDAPRSLGCDHLVGCVSMVVITAPELRSAASRVPEVALPSIAARHDAPVSALAPPPPRA